MSDRMARQQDLDDASARAGLEAAAEAAGWPLVHVGPILVGPGEDAWGRAVAEADDVGLAALAGALRFQTQTERRADDEGNADEGGEAC